MPIIQQETDLIKMNEFKTYHPIVNFTYFSLITVFSCIFTHPVCLLFSLVCGFTYSAMLKGTRAARKQLAYMIPTLLFAALINPAFNHEGVTVICYLPSGNPLTLEAVAYGGAAAAMLVGIICWFSCFNEIMTSDKLIYLFGRIVPSLSLILSMTLRFVPRFNERLKEVIRAQKCIGRDISNGGPVKRAKCALSILSVMITWSLESAIATADSMKARGYGASGRTSFSIFVFDKRDKYAFFILLFLGLYVFFGSLVGGMYFRYFPSIKSTTPSIFGFSVFAAYLLLCMYPILIELKEAAKWKSLKSKI